MNIVKGYSFFVFGWMFSGMTVVAADTMLPDSSVGDWSAKVSEFELSDGSVLFEYTARTFSGSTEGAMLAISFVPRFNCEQTVNVRLPDEVQPESADVVLEMSFDGKQLRHAGLVDDAGEFLIYSVGATVDEISALRGIIDVSDRASIRIIPDTNDSSGKVPGSAAVEFSLHGSRLVALTAQTSCLSHVPLDYKPR
ncbi:MAG: hypothetical protein AB8B64_09215 [Granulosicoccus sp.]